MGSPLVEILALGGTIICVAGHATRMLPLDIR